MLLAGELTAESIKDVLLTSEKRRQAGGEPSLIFPLLSQFMLHLNDDLRFFNHFSFG